MEKLLAYALLMSEGYDIFAEYSDVLDELYLSSPENEIYLELEIITDTNKILPYIYTVFDFKEMDTDFLGKTLMNLIRKILNESDFTEFAGHMYSLWSKLPAHLQMIEPFCMLSYADDPISWDDATHSKKLYESMVNFYQKTNKH